MYIQKDFTTSQFCDLLWLFLMNYPRSNSVLQRVKYTHFYRFCVGNKPTHINCTSPDSLYRRTPCDMSSLKNAYKDKYRFSIKPGHIPLEYDPPDIFMNTVKHSETFPMWRKEEVQHVLKMPITKNTFIIKVQSLPRRRPLPFIKKHIIFVIFNFLTKKGDENDQNWVQG